MRLGDRVNGTVCRGSSCCETCGAPIAAYHCARCGSWSGPGGRGMNILQGLAALLVVGLAGGAAALAIARLVGI